MVAALNLVANVDNWPIAESTDLLPPITKFRGVFGGRKLFLPGHFGFIFDGRVETCFYYEVSYGPLVGCVIGGVTESHTHSVAIATGAERRGFVTICGRDWSVVTPIPRQVETAFWGYTTEKKGNSKGWCGIRLGKNYLTVSSDH